MNSAQASPSGLPGAEPGRPRLVVLGGGLAGLSAAREALRNRACDVLVLEKDDRSGGMAVSLQFDEFVTDLGPHRIYSAIPEMRQWFHENVGDRLFVVRRMSRMYARGRYIPYPPSPLDMLRVFGAPMMARFGAGYAWAKARGLFGRIDVSSFGGVMERSFGRPLCEAMVFPYVRKTWKMSAFEVSSEAARIRATMGGAGKMLWRLVNPRQREGEETTLRAFHYVRGGIGNLARQLHQDVENLGGEVRCQCSVRRVAVKHGRVERVEYRDADGNIHSVPADFVISTIPLTSLVKSLSSDEGNGGPAVSSDVLAASRGLRWLRGLLVFLVLERPGLSADHWLYFPEAIPNVNRAYEPKNFDASLAPPNRTMLCIEGTALADDDEDWNRSPEDIAAEYAARVAATGIFSKGEIVAVHTRKLDYAYPLYDMGYAPRLERVWKGLSGIDNLVCAGRQGLFQHNNMDHTIFTGLHAARFWTEQASEARAARWYSDVMKKFQAFRIVD